MSLLHTSLGEEESSEGSSLIHQHLHYSHPALGHISLAWVTGVLLRGLLCIINFQQGPERSF